QSCVAGSCIFGWEGIYDEFLAKFSAIAMHLGEKIGDPCGAGTQHGPQVSQTQLNVHHVMSYIKSGKQKGATVHAGGARHGEEAYIVQPMIFTDVKPEMKIVKEELLSRSRQKRVIEAAKNTSYGLACHVFSQNISRALRVVHSRRAMGAHQCGPGGMTGGT
ncbi:hypothetical protein DXG01_004781, partial [Tephrocybe rancida]